MKKTIILLLALLVIFGLSACGGTATPQADTPAEDASTVPQEFHIGVLNGATGLSAAWFMEESAQGNTFDTYHFEVATAPDQVVSMLLSGQADIVALPTNVAATLYQRTNGEVQMLAITTLGVLHILENGDNVTEVAHLQGRTIHTTGEGANPEFVLNHVLVEHGLTPGVDVFIEFHPNEALASLMASGEIDLAMVPEPMASSILMQNGDVRRVIDMTEAWQAIGDGSQLMMSTFVAQRSFIEENTQGVLRFLALLEKSIDNTNTNPQEVGELVAQFGILPNATIATAAIAGCNLVFVSGSHMEGAIMGYFEALYQADPQSVGGALPSGNIFFEN